MEEEIRLAMEGDADAFLALMDRYNQQMYKRCRCGGCDAGNDYYML